MAPYDQLDRVRSARSWLFTPGTKTSVFDRAAAVGADAVIFDLEDSVAPADKDAARHAVITHLTDQIATELIRAVRINSAEGPWGRDDVSGLLDSDAAYDVIVVPKVESAGQLVAIEGLLETSRPDALLIPIIESARGVVNLGDILAAGNRIGAVMVGAADLAADLGARPDWAALATARGTLVIGATAARVPVIDSPYFDPGDADGLVREIALAVEAGFVAKAAIHPNQIAAINTGWTPSVGQIDWARMVLDVNAGGVGTVDGQMVDEAVARRARRFLARAR